MYDFDEIILHFQDLGPAASEGSAIDLDIGPPVDHVQNKNYKTIQQVKFILNSYYLFNYLNYIYCYF